ncbi:hypothetical protein [Sphingobium sp. CAP-1]|uniref:hypothetical protein n=1 Tax=Sphingobium sp. CAP-1 TaxID=2676077 RepID=UPI0012BB416C|nr:hypothetical protein [Sphingobium sp. CAP-1]QGP79105.1 hypothetical protein GL174_08925 [Sphingobium sp. CAP-1]
MLNLDSAKTQAVADQTRQAFTAFDTALVDAAQLTTAFIAAAQGSGLTAMESQRILQQLHDSTTKIIAGRSDMIRATALLTRCIEKSQFEVTAFGCPLGMDAPAQDEAPRHLTLVA